MARLFIFTQNNQMQYLKTVYRHASVHIYNKHGMIIVIDDKKVIDYYVRKTISTNSVEENYKKD